MEQQLPGDDISRLRNFFDSTDKVQEFLEIDGVLVTTNQLYDYTSRGHHPFLVPMTLYVY